ncbi:MAG: Plug domain-containing protein [Candidatus Desantisbacteria bacterium]
MLNQKNIFLLTAFFLLFSHVIYAEDSGTITSPSLTFYGEEFVVEAPKPEPKDEVVISKETVAADQIKDSSVSLFNDLAETLKTLPGVITPGNFSGAMFVRGGFPMETIYMLDRVFIDWPYRWGGMMTMFNTRLIDEVDFYAGGFPAEGGNSLAGCIDIRYKKGDLHKFSLATMEENNESYTTFNEYCLRWKQLDPWTAYYFKRYIHSRDY